MSEPHRRRPKAGHKHHRFGDRGHGSFTRSENPQLTPRVLANLNWSLPITNVTVNLAAVFLINHLIFRGLINLSAELQHLMAWTDLFFLPVAFTTAAVVTYRHDRPLGTFLEAKSKNRPVTPATAILARQRLLNYPFWVMALGGSIWVAAAVVYTVVFWAAGTSLPLLLRPLFVSLDVGLLTVTLVFFLTEHIIQHRFVGYFFPHGDLSVIPDTRRIRIRMRMAMVLLSCCLLPLLAVLQTLYLSGATESDPSQVLARLRTALTVNALLFMLIGVTVTGLVSMNMSRPFEEIIRVLKQIKFGRFDQKIQVRTNDEIGYTGEVINEMTAGLRERDRLRTSLILAREVQQNLLPKGPPQVEGLSIAGSSVYCDSTGGDYFDYLPLPDGDDGKVRLVVADVCDHGVQSALLMTTARAMIRQRSAMPGDLSMLVGDVNRMLARDVEDSGQFMTLLVCDLDVAQRRLTWINAGHDPVLVYNSASQSFEELSGHHIAMGVFENQTYHTAYCQLPRASVVVLTTDGVWEAHNRQGEPFGRQRLRAVIREQAHRPAEEIVTAVIQAVDAHRHPLPMEDDLTLVVARL